MAGTTIPKKTVSKSQVKLGVFTLAMINVAAIVSLRGLPSEAIYGLSSIFYYVFAAIFFLIPTSLVAAELATGWPESGGVFRWVGEAFGARAGFLAIFLQWVESTIWFPTVLTFAAVSVAFIRPNQKWDEALAANSVYTVIVVLIVYWAATFLNFQGMSLSGAISKWGTIVGTLLPGGLIILLGFIYVLQRRPTQIPIHLADVLPRHANFGSLVLAASIFLAYAGMEMSAVHVKDVKNPQRNYPVAILIASVITVAVFVFGTLAIAFIIPQSQINLVQSLLVSYHDFFRIYGLRFLSPIVAALLAVGVFAGVSTWIAGPSRGILAVGKAGYLPKVFQKTNKNGVQVNILLMQAGIVTILSVMFVVLPSVQAAYQILSQLTVTLYLIMYLLMFGAAIYLRYTQPNQPRTFKVPGGIVGMWIIGGAGFLGSLLAFVLSFIPPSQISVGSPTIYVLILIGGNVVVVAIPFIIYALRKPNWKSKSADDAMTPFSWDKTATAVVEPTSVHEVEETVCQ
jgi:putative glutamate/gamma-aminobutyrate antiporter